MDLRPGPVASPGQATKTSFVQVTAPLPCDLAWEVESLLLKVFEYGDYSFRSALTGRYSETLDCVFTLARRAGALAGVAGCLYAHANPAIALLGPVAVAQEYRRNGLGTTLVRSAVDYLKTKNCAAVYLGVSKGNPAVHLYEAAGFRPYRGIVMRLLPFGEGQVRDLGFGGGSDVSIRPVTWGDFPAVQALAVWPARMYTFDLPRGIFSSRYCEPSRFLSVFPDMMRAFARTGGGAHVLRAGERHDVVGIAWMRRLPAQAQQHVAEFDLFVCDDFLAQATPLARTTLQLRDSLSVRQIYCACVSGDHLKREILEQLGARPVASLPGQVCLKGESMDVVLYRID